MHYHLMALNYSNVPLFLAQYRLLEAFSSRSDRPEAA